GRRRLPHLLGLRPRRGRPLGHVQVARPGAERTQRDRPLVPAPRRVREGLALAYDEELAARIRALVAGEPSLTEQKMFGGLAFLVGGNMAVAASGQGGVLVAVRVDVPRIEARARYRVETRIVVSEPRAG